MIKPGLTAPFVFTLFLGWTVLSIAPVRADQDPEQGLEGGQAHEVVVAAHPTEGLEVGMPRTGWYARAIQMDIKGDWKESKRAYLKAGEEFRGMMRSRPGWEEVVKGWIIKAKFQWDQSRALVRYSTRGPRFSNDKFRHALALHHKWLGIRAFTGLADAALQRKVISIYKQAVQSSRRDQRARIYLAAFYHEAGMHQRGKREYARVLASRRSYRYMADAAYHSAAGNHEAAFRSLARAASRSDNRRNANGSNMFDALRGDPRFAKVVKVSR